MRRAALSSVALIAYGGVAQAATDTTPDISYAIVSGYPDNPAIVDATGAFTIKYLKVAEVREYKDFRLAVFPLKLHKKESVCQSTTANIYPNKKGSMIIEFNSFFPVLKRGGKSLGCDISLSQNAIRANSLDVYLAGEWARRAIADDVVAKAGQDDDPLCRKVSAVSCPAPERRIERFQQFKTLGVADCRPAETNCIVLEMMVSETSPSSRYGTARTDFTVRYTVDQKSGERKLVDFTFKEPLPVGPGQPGEPKVVRRVRN
jgi:hypothetical protein